MAQRESTLAESATPAPQPVKAGGKRSRVTNARRRNAAPAAPLEDAMDDRLNEVDREDEDNEGTLDDLDSERFAAFKDSVSQQVLPSLPRMDGYHICWLSTTNPRDTIQTRLNQGYELVRADQLNGWTGASLKTGDYAGIVGVNEMVAAKIPLRLYDRMMRHLHHQLPLEEEEKLKARTDLLKDQARAMGANVYEGDGTAEVVQRAPVPRFVE